ncbi:50S ribosomal protein L13 [Candidatus Omnitrophota bacterium]
MKKTYIPKKEEIIREWYLVDADGQILGRLAARVAGVLRGKHKPQFTPHMDTGDMVIVINACKIRVSGKKLQQKVYQRYSGYPGGLKEVPLERMLKNKPEMVFNLAVKRMLPAGTLGRKMFSKLKVYPNGQHPHGGQHPKPLNFSRPGK